MTNDNDAWTLVFALMAITIGSLDILTNDQLFAGPIFIAFGIIFAIATIFKIKKYSNRTFYNIIVAVILGIMLIGDYTLMPTENIVFNILMLLMAISLFIFTYSLLIPENYQNKTEKITSWTGLVLFLVILFILSGLLNNNITGLLILVTIVLIITTIIILIRIRIFKENTLKMLKYSKDVLSRVLKYSTEVSSRFYINYEAILAGSTVLIISEFMVSIFFGPYSTFISAFLMAIIVNYMTKEFKEFLVNFVITVFIVYILFFFILFK